MTEAGDNFTVVDYIPLPEGKPQKKSHSLKGAFYFLLGVLAYSIANFFIKTSSEYYPLGEMVILRGLIFLIPLTLYILTRYILTHSLKNLSSVFSTSHLKIHGFQGVLSAFCLYFLFYAFEIMPLSDATAISFSETFIITLLSLFFFKEHIKFKNWIAITIGFIGVLIITAPFTTPFTFHIKASLACLLAVTFDAIVLLSFRTIVKKDRMLTILFYYALFSTLGGLLFTPFETWVPLGQDHIWDILGLGIFGALGQSFLALAFRQTSPAVLAPLIYTQLLWSLLLDDMIWNKLPSFSLILGSSIIIFSGIYLLKHTKK